uniref:Uncharacterized protein n=1 Tax=Ditylenchus dipsaci TaxID=166011 RepID=A0A915DDL0_9BILA
MSDKIEQKIRRAKKKPGVETVSEAQSLLDREEAGGRRLRKQVLQEFCFQEIRCWAHTNNQLGQSRGEASTGTEGIKASD